MTRARARALLIGCFRNSRKSSKQKRSNRHTSFVATSPELHDRSQVLLPTPPSDGLSLSKNGSEEVRREVVTEEKDEDDCEIRNLSAQKFTLEELEVATSNFRQESYLGEGGFGKVYKGYLVRVNQEVAIKQLVQDGAQGAREFLTEVHTLSSADHPNLVKLIGYCVDDDQRLLIYEYMLLGSLDRHLFDYAPDTPKLDWYTRLRIAAGVARGLQYLHVNMNPPTIYCDLKCANILLGEGYHSKLSDFGLAKVVPSGDNTHVSTRVMGTHGYCAPEYAITGQLTFKSDIYSFGVVLLEIITGRKAIDATRSQREQNLVAWARPLFKDRRKFFQLVDPRLEGQCPRKSLVHALAIAAMCIHEEPAHRPAIGPVVEALEYLAKRALPCFQVPDAVAEASRQKQYRNLPTLSVD